jgi:hypothetical protein
MRSVCQSINLLCTSFGSLSAAGLNAVMSSWIPNDLNDGHLEYVFAVLALIMVLNTLAYAVVASRFQYREPREDELEPESPPPFTETDDAVRLSQTNAVRLSAAGGPVDHVMAGMRRSTNSALNRSTGDLRRRTTGRSTGTMSDATEPMLSGALRRANV